MSQQTQELDWCKLLDAVQMSVISLRTIKTNLSAMQNQCDRQIEAIEQLLAIAPDREAIASDTAPSIRID